MAKKSQKDRKAAVSSPLGADVLLFRKMHAVEQMGGLFRFDLTLLSEDPAVKFADIVGQPVTVRLARPDGEKRFLNGLVSRFVQKSSDADAAAQELATYEATLVPWLWFLTRTHDCRIFQEQTVPDIIKAVLRENGFTDFEDALTGTYRQWVYCVQYRESDFNFVSRLMEQEGIYYYFKHEDGKHKLVLADSISAHAAYDGYAELPYRPTDTVTEIENVCDWTTEQAVQPGAFALTDYDFEAPKKDLLARSKVKRKHNHADYEVFDYPGEYVQPGDGNNYSKVYIEELQAAHEVVSARSNAAGICTGYLLKVKEHLRADQNREYLITSTTLSASLDAYTTTGNAGSEGFTWQCSFTGVDSSQQFRMPRVTKKGLVQGPQTAVVVGPKGEEIWTDKYGRVKVQFHWDRYGKNDENSSCWMRVSQVWAGKTWGGIHIPRIGQEVIVDFLEGDPDQPIITGRVYNADEMPPYGLPANQTQSGIKSRSSKDGTNQNFNELRFEDKKDQEEVYFHAERDFNRIVENNDTLKVGFEKKTDGDQTIDVHNNQKVTIGNAQAKVGSQTITIWKDRDVKVKTGHSSHEAAKWILLKCGGSTIKMDPTSITIKSLKITIQGNAKVDVKAPMTQVAGDGMLTLKGGIIMIN